MKLFAGDVIMTKEQFENYNGIFILKINVIWKIIILLIGI